MNETFLNTQFSLYNSSCVLSLKTQVVKLHLCTNKVTQCLKGSYGVNKGIHYYMYASFQVLMPNLEDIMLGFILYIRLLYIQLLKSLQLKCLESTVYRQSISYGHNPSKEMLVRHKDQTYSKPTILHMVEASSTVLYGMFQLLWQEELSYFTTFPFQFKRFQSGT